MASSDSTRASIVLGSWMKANGLLNESELSKRLRERRDANKVGPQAARNAKEKNVIVVD